MTRDKQYSFNAGVLSPSFYGRTDLDKYRAGLRDALNVIVLPEGGIENRAGTRLVTGYDTGAVSAQWLIPVEVSAEDTYQLEFGDGFMRVIRAGAYVLASGSTRTLTSLSSANPAALSVPLAGDLAQFPVGSLVFIEAPGHPLHTATVRVVAHVGSTFTFRVVGGTLVDNTGGAWGALPGGAQGTRVYQVAHPFALAEMPDVDFGQDAETVYFAHPNHPKRFVFRDGADDNWVFGVVSTTSTAPAPSNPNATATGTGTTVSTYVITRLTEAGDESVPSTPISVSNDLTIVGNKNTLSWIVPGVVPVPWYNVYKRSQNGQYGYIGSSTGGFVDNNIIPDLTKSPPTGRNPLNAAGNYPSVVAFIEQRAAYAATDLEPQVIEMSSSRSPDDFERAATPRDDDAVSIRLRGQRLNRIVSIVPARSPLVLTAGEEFVLEGGDNKGYITPGNPVPRRLSRRGSARRPRPVIVGDMVLHVLPEGNRIRTIPADGGASDDLTVLVRHLFRGRRIVSFAYAQAPYSVVWVTLDNGTLLSLTFVPEQQVWGWTPHDLGGFVHQVSVVREGAYDTPYFVVTRDVAGVPTRLVERLATRDFTRVQDAYFVDSGLTVQAAGFTQIVGLLHLRGKTVAALVDGNVVSSVQVSARGVVTLAEAAATAHVGLGYTAWLTPIDVDFGEMRDGGTSLGRLKVTGQIAIMVDRTRGVSVARSGGGFFNEAKEFTGEQPIPLFTGTQLITVEGNWQLDASVTIRQAYPLPMTLVAAAPDWSMEEPR